MPDQTGPAGLTREPCGHIPFNSQAYAEALDRVVELERQRDAQRARADAAEAHLDAARARAEMAERFERAANDRRLRAEADRDRERQRAEGLAAILSDAQSGMEWALGKMRFWECDCDPGYESDTNAWIHGDDCASLWEGHFEATVEQLKAFGGER